jgi:hypothetical protein
VLGQHLLLELPRRLRLLLLGRLRRRRRLLLLLLQRVLVRGAALRPGLLLKGPGWQREQLGAVRPRLLLPLLQVAWAGRLGLLVVGCLRQRGLWLLRHCWLAQRGGLCGTANRVPQSRRCVKNQPSTAIQLHRCAIAGFGYDLRTDLGG